MTGTGMQRLPRSRIEATAASIEAFASWRGQRSSALYKNLARQIPSDPELVAIAAHGLAALEALHLFACVHYLLLRDPSDPLSRYYATLAETPAPPEQAFPDFARFVKERRDEIIELLMTRTVQATAPERCQYIAAPFSHVAKLAGEPLDIIEIGCSAGILLTFDKYAYDVKGQGRIGPADPPLTLKSDPPGQGAFHLPQIGKRIGLDLRPVDVKLEDERRWLLALCQPEHRKEQDELAAALDVVAKTDIRLLEGDALDTLPALLPESPGPLCILHSACLVYWAEEAKAELEALLLKASRGREIYRIGVEPDIKRAGEAGFSVDVLVSHYRDGVVDRKVVADLEPGLGTFAWRD